MRELKNFIKMVFCFFFLTTITLVLANEADSGKATKRCEIKNANGKVVGYGNTCETGRNTECIPNLC